MTEREKMLAGEWYDANFNPELIQERMIAQSLCVKLNKTEFTDENYNKILNEIIGEQPEGVTVLAPFMVDYGKNIHFGKNCFVNVNCYFMDGSSITLGESVFVGPYCGFYTATHPLDYKTRNKGLEKALPITVGDNCWFGANVSVMPGVTIGSGCVMAAGSVVTKDIPDNCMVAGVPAKIIKQIEQ